MTRKELKALSDDTFYDNNVGGISPEAHREFNSRLIDFVPAPVGTATNTEQGKVQGSMSMGKVSIESDGTMNVNGYIAMATFIVDSNDALESWANNAAGNDYSCVLIKSGTWELNTSVNLTTTGTKVVIGQPGSVVKISTKTSAFIYTTRPTNADCFMLNVTVYQTLSSGSGTSYAFNKCVNLYNCKVLTTAAGGTVYGMVQCKGVYNSSVDISQTASSTVNGYHSCEDLFNCKLVCNTVFASYGFHSCIRLHNCYSEIKIVGTSVIYCYENCMDLNSCYAYLPNSSQTGQQRGFSTCRSLMNCEVSAVGAGAVFGFTASHNIVNCHGDISGASGSVFNACRILFGNYPNSVNTGTVFNACYMTISGSTYPVAETAAGGYNRTTY